MKCKTFDRFLKEMNQTPGKLNQWLEDKRLTQLEKKIILGYSLIRNNQNTRVLEELENIPESDIDFVNAHKNLLLGIACNNLTRFPEAKNYLEHSTKAMHELELHYYWFVSCFNQFMLYSNLRDYKLMKKSLETLRKIPLDSRMLEIRLLRCEFIYAHEVDQNKEAQEYLNKISKIKDEMVESDLIAHLVTEFMFYVKLEELDKARATLVSMKSYRKFHLSENYNFMKKLLDHLTDNSPIYAYDQDFQDIPMLYHQLKVIQSLEAQELSEAQLHWDKLHALMPEVYLDNFEYKDTQCLFSLCLNKHKKVEKKPTATFTGSDEQFKLDKLIHLLQSSEAPLSKGHLYEILWGEPPEDKVALQRLTRLVYKARQSKNLDIQTRKGTYFLVTPPKKAAV